ncbi:MAG: mandelate racemase [Actinobacteria bacterium]|nr:MAG: mandelate racemase [Actinomycetota bacterium]
MTTATQTQIEKLDVFARTIPTDEPESDGTLAWDSTTIVVVQAHAESAVGLGYTYTHEVAAKLIEDKLQDVVRGRDPLDVEGAWHAMSAALRNIGRPGLGFMAISAVDLALWDLKARLMEQPLVGVLDTVHDAVPIYGSGGFCSYSDERLRDQLGGWAAQGIPRVKMKVGREPERDRDRVTVAREAIGDDTDLFVDANGAFSRQEAVAWAHVYADGFDVKWFEEPVTSDDLEGLRIVRDESPDRLDIAAGEYGDLLPYFERMAPVVDCLQADVTRCGGITGLLAVARVAEAQGVDLSGHCAPAISAHAFSAVPRLRHLEYFHDHVRVEHMLFDGVLVPDGDVLRPDRSRLGNGLELK